MKKQNIDKQALKRIGTLRASYFKAVFQFKFIAARLLTMLDKLTHLSQSFELLLELIL